MTVVASQLEHMLGGWADGLSRKLAASHSVVTFVCGLRIFAKTEPQCVRVHCVRVSNLLVNEMDFGWVRNPDVAH